MATKTKLPAAHNAKTIKVTKSKEYKKQHQQQQEKKSIHIF